MGFIEETGVAQLYRDVRIAPIYEGTNGIQANDLVGRKLMRDKGAAARDFIAGLAGLRWRPGDRARRGSLRHSRRACRRRGRTVAQHRLADRDPWRRSGPGARRRHALSAAVRHRRGRLADGHGGAGSRRGEPAEDPPTRHSSPPSSPPPASMPTTSWSRPKGWPPRSCAADRRRSALRLRNSSRLARRSA